MYTKIIDCRSDFKKKSFSNYKVTDIKGQLIKYVTSSDIEKSCFFVSELICSGLYIDLWEIILHILGKFIYNCNLKLICYIEIKFYDFKMYINSGVDELQLRNSENIRILFCEMISIMCLSNKSQSISRVKIEKNDLDSIHLTSKLKANNVEYANKVFSSGNDPIELFISINELIYNINCENPNQFLIFFWIEWIIKFTQVLKKNKKNTDCKLRNYPVGDKHKKNVIFLILDCIKTKQTDNPLIKKCINSLINLFCIRYSASCNSKRIYLIYLCVNILISKNINTSVPITNDISLIQKIKNKNDFFYKEIKKNEVHKYTGGEGIDDGEKSSIDKSMERINIVMGNTKN